VVEESQREGDDDGEVDADWEDKREENGW
jgi:hypothetical protein